MKVTAIEFECTVLSSSRKFSLLLVDSAAVVVCRRMTMAVEVAAGVGRRNMMWRLAPEREIEWSLIVAGASSEELTIMNYFSVSIQIT